MRSRLQRELAALEQLSSRELKDRYEQLFGEPPLSGHRRHLLKRIAMLSVRTFRTFLRELSPSRFYR